MTPADQAIISQARQARAAFYGSCALILDLERTGHIGATAAIKLVRKEYERQLPSIDNEEALMARLVDELKANRPSNESPMVDDVPLV